MLRKCLAEFIGTFWLAPLLGGVLAGVLYRTVLEREAAEPATSGQHDPGLRPAHR